MIRLDDPRQLFALAPGKAPPFTLSPYSCPAFQRDRVLE
jgi:hypothetical protein